MHSPCTLPAPSLHPSCVNHPAFISLRPDVPPCVVAPCHGPRHRPVLPSPRRGPALSYISPISPQARAALAGLEGLVAPRTQGGRRQCGAASLAASSAGRGGESVAATGGAVASGAAVSHAVLSVLADLVTEIAISTRELSLETCAIAPSSDATGPSSPAGGTSGGGAALQRRRSSGDIAPVMLAAEVIAWA